MRFTLICLMTGSTLLLSACETMPDIPLLTKPEPVQQTTQNQVTGITSPIGAIVLPEPSPPVYPINALNGSNISEYEQLIRNELEDKDASTASQSTSSPYTNQEAKEPLTQNQIRELLQRNRVFIPTVSKYEKSARVGLTSEENEWDVTTIDAFLAILEGKARHYPAQFADKNERRNAIRRLSGILTDLDAYADAPNASYDILLRALKANVMARNLDMGQEKATKSMAYAKRIFEIKPSDAEASFWYGFGLSEGGARVAATSYLNTAIDANIQEAYLSLANNYLLLEQKKNAIDALNRYKFKYPNESTKVDQLIDEINNSGRYSIWHASKAPSAEY